MTDSDEPEHEAYTSEQLVEKLDESMMGLKLHGNNSSGAFERGVRNAVKRIEKLEGLLEDCLPYLKILEREKSPNYTAGLMEKVEAMLSQPEGSGEEW